MAVILAKKYPGITLTLVDLSPDMAKAATGYINESGMARRIRYLVGDGGDAAFINALGAYDCVYTTFSLHHWREPETSLRNLWQAVAPGGVMVVHDFRRINWLASLAGSGGMGKSIRSSFKPEEMKSMLQKIGATDVSVKALPWSLFQTAVAKKQ
jgi:SAM-dependent methyltransferase